MGLFDKKFCDVCGNKIGLLGNRKLEDGNLCKECAKKLSPWFSERRHSTLSEIKAQLDYREANKAKVSAFSATRTYGERARLLIDERKCQFMVAKSGNLIEENPDVLDFSMARGCEPVIDENRHEKKRKNSDGSYVSYNPPRYEYSYSIDVKIFVDHPYFDEMKFNISNGYIDTGETCMMNMNFTAGWTVNRSGFGFGESRGIQQYNDCIQLGNEIKAAVERMQNGGQQYGAQAQYAQPAAQYGAQPQYAQPAAQYGAQPQYAQPAAQYGAQPQYAQPAAQYGAQPQYAQPAAQYGAQPQYAQPAAQYDAQQTPYAQPAAAGNWVCNFCGTANTGNFCSGCGAKRQ